VGVKIIFLIQIVSFKIVPAVKCILETEFCNIIFAFPYIYHIFMGNDSICDINECPAIVTYIKKNDPFTN